MQLLWTLLLLTVHVDVFSASFFVKDEMCRAKVTDCISKVMPCWLRCKCRGYTSGICFNSPDCTHPGYPWKCECWTGLGIYGRDSKHNYTELCAPWNDYLKNEYLANKLEMMSKTILHDIT